MPIDLKIVEETEAEKIIKFLIENKNNNQKSHKNIEETNVHNQGFKYLTKNFFFKNKTYELKFTFNLKKIDLSYPLNPETFNTEIVILKFYCNLKFTQYYEYQEIYELKTIGKTLEKIEENLNLPYFQKNITIFAQNYTTSKMNINFMFYDFDLKIVNYVGGIIMENDLNQQIISNLRFSIFIKKFLILNKNTSITSIEIRVEPILFILGVGHLKTMKRFFDFLYYLYNWYYYGDKEDDKKNAEKEINLSKSVKKNISTKIIIPTNLLKFNYLMEVNLNLEKTKIQIFDNFEKYQCPLIICDFSNTFIK